MPDYSVILADSERETELVGGPDGLYLTEINPPLVARENTYAQGADAEGRRRVRSVATNPEGSFRVRVDWSAGDDIDLYADLDDFQDLVESAHRDKGTLKLTPEDGEAVTFDLESIRISEFPHDASLIVDRRTELTVEFETRPYGRLDPVEVVASTSLDGPIASVEVDLSNVSAHTDLWGELTVTDDNAANTNYEIVEYGYEQTGYDPDAPSDLILVGDTDLVLTDYAGTGNQTQTGGYAGANNGITATLVTEPIVVCGTGSQPHVGKKRITARLQVNTGAVQVRLRWRVGDGSYRAEPWRTVPGEDTWADVDLAVIDIEEVPEGTHAWDGLLEAKGASFGDVLWVDYVEIIPAEVWGRASGLSATEGQGTPTAYDDFNQTPAALHGLTADFGGTWDTDEGAGDDPTDFAVTSDEVAVRSEVSDANIGAGRYAVIGSAVAASSVQVDVKFTQNDLGGTEVGRFGVLARYASTDDWIFWGLQLGDPQGELVCILRDGGTMRTLYNGPESPYLAAENVWYTLKLTVDAAGNWAGYWGINGSELFLAASGYDADLVTAASHDDGKVGFFDAQTSATVNTRSYDNFLATDLAGSSTTSPALYDDQSLRITHESAEREDSAGTSWGRVPQFQGEYLRIPPATLNERVGRLALRVRTRAEGQTATGDVTDGGAMALTVTPRVLLTGG